MSSSSDDCNEIVSKFCSKITVSLPKGTFEERHSKKSKQSISDNLRSSAKPLNKELECQLGQLQKNLKEFVAYTENLEKRLKAEQNRNHDLCGQLQTAEKENKSLSKQLQDGYAKVTTSTACQAQQQDTWELHDDAKAVEGASRVSRKAMTHQPQDQPEIHRLSSNLDGLYSTLRPPESQKNKSIQSMSNTAERSKRSEKGHTHESFMSSGFEDFMKKLNSKKHDPVDTKISENIPQHERMNTVDFTSEKRRAQWKSTDEGLAHVSRGNSRLYRSQENALTKMAKNSTNFQSATEELQISEEYQSMRDYMP